MRQKLALLELGRGIAAIAVVLCHIQWYLVETPDYLHFVWPWGSWGVKFFFALSGFIIYFVNGHEIGSGSPQTFAWRRFVRIFPTYWLVFVGALALRQFAGNADYALQITPAFLVENLLLWPSRNLFINVAWSLRHELLFYAIFLVCIWNVRAGLTLVSLWLALVIGSLLWFGFVDESHHTPWDTVASPQNLLFLIGASLAALARRLNLSHLLSRGPPLSAWLGRISYPLYLCHIPMFLVAHGLLKRFGHADSWVIASALGVALSFVTATLIANYFERPILRHRTSPVPLLSY